MQEWRIKPQLGCGVCMGKHQLFYGQAECTQLSYTDEHRLTFVVEQYPALTNLPHYLTLSC